MERPYHELESEPMRRLYWTHIKTLRDCPQRYLWTKGHPNHDLGAGMGQPKPLPPEEMRASEHHLLMGSVLSRVVELIYNEELWREPQTLLQKAEEIAQREFHYLESQYYCLWQRMTREEAQRVCVEGARNFIRILKENKLLGQWNKSELKMTPALTDSVSICGIADLVYQDQDGDYHILDGKNASTPMKYEDPDQLRWYALAFKLQYGITPKSLGFFYFRYPSTNPPKDQDPETWTGMHKVSISKDDIRRLGKEAHTLSMKIESGVFEATPKPKNCGFCPYEPICPERQAQREENARKRGLRKPKVEIPQSEQSEGSFKLLKLGVKK